MILIVCSALGAQVLPGRASASGVGQTPLSLRTGSQGTFSTSADVIFGTGAVGPYNASYKPINQFSESVSVDGKVQQRDFDYSIDYAAGSVTFKKAIGASSAIRVEYSYDPTKATSVRAPVSIPLNLDLVKKQNGGLSFTGLYKQGDRNVQNTSDLVVYGLTGDKKLGQGSNLTSMFLFNPDTSSQDNSDPFSDRSAMKFGGSTKSDKFQLNTSYLRVGEKFAGAKDYNLQQGVEAMDLSAAFAAGKSLNLSSSFNRTEALAGDKKGEAVSTSQARAVLTPNAGSKLTLAHTQVDKDSQTAADVKTVTDSVLLEQKLSTKMSATATHDSVTTDAGSNANNVTTNQLVLNAKPSDNLAITSRVTQKDSSTDGGQVGYGMAIKAAPSKTMSIDATMNQLTADTTGKAAAETFNLVANPSKLLNMEMKLAHSNTDAGGDEMVHHLKIVSAPRSDWRLELGLNGRNASAQDDFARTFLLSTTAVKNTSVQFNWADSQSDVSGDQQTQGVRVVSTPFRIVTVSGGLSQRQTLSSTDINRDAALEVRPFKNTTVAGAYRETTTNGTVVAKTQEVSASTKPGSFIQLSGGFKNRATVGQEDLNSVNAAIQVDTGTLLKLTGSYATNPEDNKGVVQRVNAQSVGMKTDFGRVKVKGSYTFKDEYLVCTRGQQTDVGLDYRMSPSSLLTTNYSIDQHEDTSLLQTHVYAIGYTQNVGSRLNLYLTGRMTTYEKDRAVLDDQTDYEAEARLGMKF
jgi:hypothetical protein